MRISKDFYDWDESPVVRPEGGLYFAYGANIGTPDMALRCPTAKPLVAATLPDWRLCFQSFANVEPVEGESTPGVLWYIQPGDEAALDSFEGVAGGFYYKALLPVETEGNTIWALVYIMNRHELVVAPPSYYYLHNIQDGYFEWHLPMDKLDAAVDRSKVVQHA